jgi:hypothetical protein
MLKTAVVKPLLKILMGRLLPSQRGGWEGLAFIPPLSKEGLGEVLFHNQEIKNPSLPPLGKGRDKNNPL